MLRIDLIHYGTYQMQGPASPLHGGTPTRLFLVVLEKGSANLHPALVHPILDSGSPLDRTTRLYGIPTLPAVHTPIDLYRTKMWRVSILEDWRRS